MDEPETSWWQWATSGPLWLVSAIYHDSALRQRAYIVVAALLVCAYAVGVMGYVIVTPEIGVRCAFTRVVNHVYPGFVLPPEEGQPALAEGDVLVQVGPEKVNSWGQVLRQMLKAASAPADGVTLADVDGERLVRVAFEREMDEGTVQGVAWCRLGPAPLETLVPSVLWFFLKVGLCVVGAIVYWQRPDDRPAAQFFLLCVVSFGAYMGGYHWARIVTQPALLFVFISCAVFLPAVTLHFYLVFPRPKSIPDGYMNWVLIGTYVPALVFLCLFLLDYLGIRAALNEGGDGRFVENSLASLLVKIYVYFGIAAAMYLGSVVALLHSYYTAAGAAERNQVRWILFGSALATLPIGYSLYLAVFEPSRFGGGAATWPMFAASACVTVAYAVSITRYRLMQLDQLISSSAGYFLISVLAGAVYTGLVCVFFLVVGSIGEGPSLSLQTVAVFCTAALVFFLLDQFKGGVMRALERHFRREKSQLDRTLQQMSEAVGRLVGPTALARRLLRSSAELLSAGGGAVYLRKGEPAVYHLADSLGPAPPLAELSPGCPLVEALRANGTFALDGAGPALRQLVFLNGALAQGLFHEGQLLGLLVIGPRDSAPYSEEDVQLLAAFAQVTALALITVEGHQTIEALNGELRAKVEKIAEQQRRILALQNQLTRREAAQATEEEPAPGAEEPAGMVGSGATMTAMAALARRVAGSSSAVLLRGESGTGKEVMARLLHESSPRAGKAFIKVHCAALSPTLLESELFGHVKGAFTGAIRDKVGRFEAADGGTLFLDEIGDISLEVQTKLLRVLEEMSFERVGSVDPVQVDVRIIAATHRDLEAMIREGKFREDLYFRLNVISLSLPPLRERREDIPELVQHFLALYGGKMGKKGLEIDDEAMEVLKAYNWPGNIRQLENVIERAVVICEGGAVMASDLPEEVRVNEVWEDSLPELAAGIRSERADRDRREKERLVRALAAAGGNKAEAARALGWARSTLVSRLKKFGLS